MRNSEVGSLQSDQLLIFMIVSFALAAVVIMQREKIPAPIRRPLAIITLIMVASSFIMLIVTLFQLGT